MSKDYIRPSRREMDDALHETLQEEAENLAEMDAEEPEDEWRTEWHAADHTDAWLRRQESEALSHLRQIWQEQDSAELVKVNTTLSLHGYDYPQGAQGVDDALRLEKARREELTVKLAELKRLWRDMTLGILHVPAERQALMDKIDELLK